MAKSPLGESPLMATKGKRPSLGTNPWYGEINGFLTQVQASNTRVGVSISERDTRWTKNSYLLNWSEFGRNWTFKRRWRIEIKVDKCPHIKLLRADCTTNNPEKRVSSSYKYSREESIKSIEDKNNLLPTDCLVANRLKAIQNKKKFGRLAKSKHYIKQYLI